MNTRTLHIPAIVGTAVALFAVAAPLQAAPACHEDPFYVSKLINGEPLNCVTRGNEDKQGVAGRKAEPVRTSAKQAGSSDLLTIKTP